jgi:hypothetical protein
VGSRAVLDAVVKRKNPQPLPGVEPPIIQPVAQRFTTQLTRLVFDAKISRKYNTRGLNTLFFTSN